MLPVLLNGCAALAEASSSVHQNGTHSVCRMKPDWVAIRTGKANTPITHSKDLKGQLLPTFGKSPLHDHRTTNAGRFLLPADQASSARFRNRATPFQSVEGPPVTTTPTNLHPRPVIAKRVLITGFARNWPWPTGISQYWTLQDGHRSTGWRSHIQHWQQVSDPTSELIRFLERVRKSFLSIAHAHRAKSKRL